MNAIEHLPEFAWKTPQHYAGFSPIGDYVLCTQHRDSDALSRSNWIRICEDFGAEAYDGKPISRFAIRHDYPPSDDQGYIQEQLR